MLVLSVLGKVQQGQNVSGFLKMTGFVGHPDLNLVDGHGSFENGDFRQGLIVGIVEMMPQEKVSVGIVVGGIDVKLGLFCASLGIDHLRLSFLL